MKIPYAIFISLFFFQLSYSQVTYQKYFGVNIYQHTANDIQPTMDNQFIIGGTTTGHGIGGISDLCMLKVDPLGNESWCKYYGNLMEDNIKFIRQTNDSGFICAGVTSPAVYAPYSITYMKANSNGVMQWNRKIDTLSNLNGLELLSNGDFLLFGGVVSPSTLRVNLFIMRINASGDTLWTKTYSHNWDLYAKRIIETPDGGLLISGYSSDNPTRRTFTFFLKLDQTGSIQWSNAFTVNYHELANWMEKTNDGGYILAGTITNANPDTSKVFITKTDSLGNVDWFKIYGYTNPLTCSKIIQTHDNGFAVIGVYNRWHLANNDYICLIKTDNQGNFSWAKLYGDTVADRPGAFLQTGDNGYLIAGLHHQLLPSSYSQIYLIKTDASGNSGCQDYDFIEQAIDMPVLDTTISITESFRSFTFSSLVYQMGTSLPTTTACSTVDINEGPTTEDGIIIYPNPASDYILFMDKEADGIVSIYNTLGSLVLRMNSISKVDLSKLPTGIYFVNINKANKNFVKKFVIDRD